MRSILDPDTKLSGLGVSVEFRHQKDMGVGVGFSDTKNPGVDVGVGRPRH